MRIFLGYISQAVELTTKTLRLLKFKWNSPKNKKKQSLDPRRTREMLDRFDLGTVADTCLDHQAAAGTVRGVLNKGLGLGQLV